MVRVGYWRFGGLSARERKFCDGRDSEGIGRGRVVPPRMRVGPGTLTFNGRGRCSRSLYLHRVCRPLSHDFRGEFEGI